MVKHLFLFEKKANMKNFIFIIFSFNSLVAIAQPVNIKQAVIYTTTNITAPDQDDVSSIQNQGSGGGMQFRNFGDGEIKSVTYIKNDLIKTVIKTDMGRSTIIRNNASKLTTTLLEIMGNKTGFYATDEEQAGMRKSMDSMMKARTKDSTAGNRLPQETPVVISHTEESKKIAGYICKKAFLVSTRLLGLKDTAVVWYTSDFKINNLTSTGGGFSMGIMGMGSSNAGSINGLSLIEGFVLRYETKMRRGRTMTVEVTKADITKEIADKEFDIPKDFDLKPMKEMRSMMQGGQGNIQIMRPN